MPLIETILFGYSERLKRRVGFGKFPANQNVEIHSVNHNPTRGRRGNHDDTAGTTSFFELRRYSGRVALAET